ncbi:MAG: hypothetical protein K0M47_09530, partial [Rhizobium sp.]|nr:hypothetical protein [Rhizobium sp.]
MHEQKAQVTFRIRGSRTYLIEEKTLELSAPAVSFVQSQFDHGLDQGTNSDALENNIDRSAQPLVAASRI